MSKAEGAALLNWIASGYSRLLQLVTESFRHPFGGASTLFRLWLIVAVAQVLGVWAIVTSIVSGRLVSAESAAGAVAFGGSFVCIVALGWFRDRHVRRARGRHLYPHRPRREAVRRRY